MSRKTAPAAASLAGTEPPAIALGYIAGYNMPQSWFRVSLPYTFRRKFDLAEAMLGGRYGFYRPEGGFFLWLEVEDGEGATLRLWREAAIRVLPGGYTARAANSGNNPGNRYIRLAIVHDEATLEDAFTRIRRVL